MNVPSLLIEAATKSPGGIALLYRDQCITFADLAWAVDRCAATLVHQGIIPGDYVAVVTGNHPGFVVGLLGALRAGAVAVPINPQFRSRELEMALSNTGTKQVVADEERREICEAAAGDPLLMVDEAGSIADAAYGPLQADPG